MGGFRVARSVWSRAPLHWGVWRLGCAGLASFALAVALLPASSARASGTPIGACTFAALKSAAEAGGTWSLSACTSIEFGQQTIAVPGGVNVTFEATGSVTLAKGAPFFIVPSGASLTLVGLTLKEGFVHGLPGTPGTPGTTGGEGHHGTEGAEGISGVNNELGSGTSGAPGDNALPGSAGTAGGAGAAGTAGGEARGGAVQVEAGGSLTVHGGAFYEDEAHGGEGGWGGKGGEGGLGGVGEPGGQGGTGGSAVCADQCAPEAAGGGDGAPGGSGSEGEPGGAGGLGGAGGDAQGGAIYNAGTLSISGATQFFEDRAYGGFGGSGGEGGPASGGGSGGKGGRGGGSGCNSTKEQQYNCGRPGEGGQGGGGAEGGTAGAWGAGAPGGDAQGGAIYNTGTATVLEASFEKNIAKGGVGNGNADVGAGPNPGAGGHGGGGGNLGAGGAGGPEGPTSTLAPSGAPGMPSAGKDGGAAGTTALGGSAEGGAIANSGTLTLIAAESLVNEAEGGAGGEGSFGGTGGAGGSSASGGNGGNGAAGANGGSAHGGLLFTATTATVSTESMSADKAVGGKGGAGGGGGGAGGQDTPNGNPGVAGSNGAAGDAGEGADPEIDGTIVSPGGVPVNTVRPAISGVATAGEQLTGSAGEWAGEPSITYAYAWDRCEADGEGCTAISGASEPQYTLTSADVGHEIELQVTASNGNGPSEPALSLPTSVVQTATPGGGSPGGGSPGGGSPSGGSPGGGGNSGNGSSSGAGATGGGSGAGASQGAAKAAISSSQIATLLSEGLAPKGKGAKISALLKAGLFATSATALEAGTLSVSWYYRPPGARLSRHARVKAILLASGRASFAGAASTSLEIKLTHAGRRLLADAKRLKVTAEDTFTPTGGVAVSATSTFLLKR
jgi:hypothetical protein